MGHLTRGTSAILARKILLFAIIATCVGCDQATKSLATHHLQDSGPISAFGGTIRLQYAENPGGFLSLGAHMDPVLRLFVFVVVVVAMLAVLGIYILKSREVTPSEMLAVALVLGGGIGNLVDRVLFGFVRDFANVGFGPIRTGVFNFADVAITAGALLLLVGALSAKIRASRLSRRP